MLRLLYQDPKFEKQINQLQKADKKAAIAVKEAEKIINNLAEGVIPESAGVVTRHGEYRINNCIKYDLGSGYRLITIKDGVHLSVLFIGSHDECHQWIENNKHAKPELYKKRAESIEVAPLEAELSKDPEDTETQWDDPLDQLDDKSLRMIFRGLCGE
jgi:hypothetical protein